MINVFQAPDEPKSLNTTSIAAQAIDVDGGYRFVDFNGIIQDFLNEERARLDRLNAIIRCDALPHVYASENDMRRLCELLIHLLLPRSPKKSKLFIYIKCNSLEKEVLPAIASCRLHFYDICFHTNSCNDVSWQATHERVLTECNRICNRYSGTLVSASGSSDCLFKLTLPGKLF